MYSAYMYDAKTWGSVHLNKNNKYFSFFFFQTFDDGLSYRDGALCGWAKYKEALWFGFAMVTGEYKRMKCPVWTLWACFVRVTKKTFQDFRKFLIKACYSKVRDLITSPKLWFLFACVCFFCFCFCFFFGFLNFLCLAMYLQGGQGLRRLTRNNIVITLKAF